VEHRRTLKTDAHWFIYADMGFVKPTEPPACTLIHLSDFHVCRPETAPWSAFWNKRTLSVLSWKIRRARAHHSGVFDRLAEAAGRIAADQVTVTGDLTQLGLPAEFDLAVEHLCRLGPPDKVFVVPGNHDALVAGPAAETLAGTSGYLASDPPHETGRPRFPTLRVCGRIALIGVSSAHPTPPLSAAGSIGADQLARLAALLQSCGQKALFRVILIHHPPLADGVAPRKRLLDAAALHAVIARHGAELALHGHTHRRSRGRLVGPEGLVPVFGISSATATGGDRLHRAAFHVFRIYAAGQGWRTTLQTHARDPGRGEFLAEAEEPL
jgi:3',5'-cyclic AMP phosphodiesterase CpdA